VNPNCILSKVFPVYCNFYLLYLASKVSCTECLLQIAYQSNPVSFAPFFLPHPTPASPLASPPLITPPSPLPPNCVGLRAGRPPCTVLSPQPSLQCETAAHKHTKCACPRHATQTCCWLARGGRTAEHHAHVGQHQWKAWHALWYTRRWCCRDLVTVKRFI
jgi:hypothetical protein